jgi:ABC-type multidrug transport system ATPase subunit
MSTATVLDLACDQPAPSHRAGLTIDAVALSQTLRNGNRVLDDISLTIRPGELVAIVGGSGAGKSTLLDALAGVRPASHGTVRFDGVEVDGDPDARRSAIGYVPQDDIIHRDLPVRTTLRYAAQLRLPRTARPAETEALVQETLATLGLHDRADVPVGRLSGGQRKRASIGVELLTRPRAFFLDEPTSGLDAATSHELMGTLRRLTETGTTVVLTTHNTDDLRRCDRVVFLAHGGRLAYDGTLEAAKRHFGVDDVAEIYGLLAATDDWAPRRAASEAESETPREASNRAGRAGRTPRLVNPQPGALRQWAVLTRRNVDLLVRNRLTLAITFGSPALVIAMFAVLFKPGAFDTVDPDPAAAVMIAFWTAFAGFFFGLTFGLLQICTEVPIVRRERFVGLNLGSYLAAKLTVLVPVLGAVIGTMIGVLTVLDRLPATSAALALTLLLDAVAATTLGLLASAIVGDPAQATLALPMLCFPAVLFSGAIVPTRAMAAAGEAISVFTSDRWAFEAVGRQLGLDRLAATTSGSSTLTPYGDALTGPVAAHWLIMAAFAVAFLVAAHRALHRRARPA